MNAQAQHTQGPWTVNDSDADQTIWAGEDCVATAWLDPNVDANARLIAAAPDHALIARAMCIGAGRWEPFGDGRGEFCMNGQRHATWLDEFGVPVITNGMRAALAKATQA